MKREEEGVSVSEGKVTWGKAKERSFVGELRGL
jgi:hypothetical protein